MPAQQTSLNNFTTTLTKLIQENRPYARVLGIGLTLVPALVLFFNKLLLLALVTGLIVIGVNIWQLGKQEDKTPLLQRAFTLLVAGVNDKSSRLTQWLGLSSSPTPEQRIETGLQRFLSNHPASVANAGLIMMSIGILLLVTKGLVSFAIAAGFAGIGYSLHRLIETSATGADEISAEHSFVDCYLKPSLKRILGEQFTSEFQNLIRSKSIAAVTIANGFMFGAGMILFLGNIGAMLTFGVISGSGLLLYTIASNGADDISLAKDVGNVGASLSLTLEIAMGRIQRLIPDYLATANNSTRSVDLQASSKQPEPAANPAHN